MDGSEVISGGTAGASTVVTSGTSSAQSGTVGLRGEIEAAAVTVGKTAGFAGMVAAEKAMGEGEKIEKDVVAAAEAAAQAGASAAEKELKPLGETAVKMIEEMIERALDRRSSTAVAAVSEAASDDPAETQAAVATQPSESHIVPALGESVWGAIKAWVRHDHALAATGVSHEDRQAQNP